MWVSHSIAGATRTMTTSDGSPRESSTRYFFRVVTVFVQVATVTSTTVVPNPSSLVLVSVDR